MSKKYISKINKDGEDLYIKDAEAQERLDQLSEWESDGAIDTLFDTEYVPASAPVSGFSEGIIFGSGCASFDNETGVMTIEGAVVPIDMNDPSAGQMIVIS